MIDKILTHIAEGLNMYLGNFYEEPAGLVKVGEIGNTEETERDKLAVALLNIEREGAMGIGSGFQAEGKGFLQKFPPWHLNVYFVVAALFEGKRYEEGVKMLSESIAYLQQHPEVRLVNGKKYTIEPVSLNFQELTNIWSVLGGRYCPSVVCKVRMLTFDGDGFGRYVGRARKTNEGEAVGRK